MNNTTKIYGSIIYNKNSYCDKEYLLLICKDDNIVKLYKKIDCDHYRIVRNRPTCFLFIDCESGFEVLVNGNSYKIYKIPGSNNQFPPTSFPPTTFPPSPFTSPIGFPCICPPGSPGGVIELASFFGMTAGSGNPGPDDYAVPIAVSAAGSSSNTGAASVAINFPRVAAPAVGGIVINNPNTVSTQGGEGNQFFNTEFLLPSVGTYNVRWHISVNEAAQFSLFTSVIPYPPTNGTGSFTPLVVPPVGLNAGGNPSQSGQATGTVIYNGDVTFYNAVAGTAIQIRNFASSAALIVTPIPGGTNAQAAVITITRLA